MNNYLNRRKFILGTSCAICSSLMLHSCAEVPLTNRKQLNFYKYNVPIILPSGGVAGLPQIYANEKHLNDVIDKQYSQFIDNARSKKILIENTIEAKNIKEIGMSISNSIEKYYNNKGEENPVQNFKWEFALIDAKDQNGNLIKNAWCMPGGKIAFYTGIMPIAKNEDGIASIMGHEIAHAFARHTIEKLTQTSIISLGTQALSASKFGTTLAQNSNIYNNLIQFGLMLPFSRKMESEADYMGLIFMNLSGFDMYESIDIWKRMQKASENERVSEFISSHPSPENRIENLQKWIDEVKIDYPKV